MDTSMIGGFVAVAVLAYVTPGPDWFIVLRAAARSRRHGFTAAAGVLSGLTVHIAAAGVGVSALLLASAEAFTLVKLVGAGYLVVLGVRALLEARATWRRHEPDAVDEPDVASGGAAATSWATAFTTNVLNPKAALFFVAVLPQFLSPTTPVLPQVVVLGALDIVLGALWYSIFTVTVSRFRAVLRRRRARAVLDAGSGVALIGMGGALAALGRRA